MGQSLGRKIEPSDHVSPDILRQIDSILNQQAKLVSESGESIPLPNELYEPLKMIVASMLRREAIFMVHESESFTTQAAAHFLGVSRPHLIKLIEEGLIPHYKVGNHRRIRAGDLYAYREHRDRSRKETLSRLFKKLDEDGVYDAHE